MSRFDYSKWDRIVDSDDEEESSQPQQPPSPQTQAAEMLPEGIPPGAQQIDPNNLPPEIKNDPAIMRQLAETNPKMKKVNATPKGSEAGRHGFEYNGRTIYEWDQDLNELNLWIQPPDGVTKSHLDITISHQHLRIGLKGEPPHASPPPFIDEDTGGEVIVEESFWMLQNGELNINLQKMRKGVTWSEALRGHGQLDPMTQQEDQKRIMLERFQEEHPGFDFSGADFNGQIPDAREFMGGVKYF